MISSIDRDRIEFDADSRVRAGTRLLDRCVPDWRRRVDPNTLDLYSSMNCMLGQLFGTYVAGVITLRVLRAAHDLGFDCHSEFENDALVRAWRAELERDAA